MMDYRVHRAAPNLVCICVDQVDDSEYSGRIYHKYHGEAVLFSHSMQLIMTLNRFFDEIDYPQASTICRSFSKPKQQSADKRERKWTEPRKPVQTEDWVLDQNGKLATFYLHVQYRQKSTWQGNVIWKEAKKWTGFESVLELLRLLQSALDGER